MNQPLVKIEQGKPMTTSVAVANFFERKHKTVLDAIRRVMTDCSEDFSRQIFLPRDYLSDRGKIHPMYFLTFDGFAMIALGFTGTKAIKFRESYVKEFRRKSDKEQRKQIDQLEGQYVRQKYLPFEQEVIRESVSLSDACKHLRILGIHLTLTPAQLKGKIKRGELEGHQDARGYWRIYVDQVTKLATGH